MISDDSLSYILESTNECVICGNTGVMMVDHDHKAHKIRGILCRKCNVALGHFNDDPDLLEFARIYILSSRDDDEASRYLQEKP